MTYMSLIILRNKGIFVLMGQYRDEILNKKIALRICELRKNKGITQEQFYNDTDIHIGRIETGNGNITVSSLKRICDYLDVSLGDFFSEIG